ncbi:hypothetical protein [Candidatus Poriferisodalis sp.]
MSPVCVVGLSGALAVVDVMCAGAAAPVVLVGLMPWVLCACWCAGVRGLC